MADDKPPVAKYELTLTIHGNSHEEIERELLVQTRGGYLLDSEYNTRDSFHSISGRVVSRLEHTNDGMTPERYERELREWAARRKLERSSKPSDS